MSAEPKHRKGVLKDLHLLKFSEGERQRELSYHKAGRRDLTLLPSMSVS